MAKKFAVHNKEMPLNKGLVKYGSLASARTSRSRFIKLVPSAKNKLEIIKL